MESSTDVPKKKKKIRIELPYNPTVSLLNVFPKKIKTLIEKAIHIRMLITEVYTSAKIWK